MGYTSFGGDPALLEALASFFNAYFNPSIAVVPGHLVVAAGAGSCLDALMCGICEPGDTIIVLGPCFSLSPIPFSSAPSSPGSEHLTKLFRSWLWYISSKKC